jgi:transcriptional regulator NrdR family protein
MVKTKKINKINQFDCERLQKSVMKACLSARRPDGQAEATAKAVCKEVVKWLEQRPDITSNDLRRIAAKHLDHYDPEAAYLYAQTHITI